MWNAYLSVKRSKGGAGFDEQIMEEFENDLKNNLYKIWNRLSSGSYFPTPVLKVEIPKSNGKLRELGIPTIKDRIAQTVIKARLEKIVEPRFHKDSYGYRPNKSALMALETTRKRCWMDNWVLDLDMEKFFDTLDHELVLRAVRKFTDSKLILLYVERWLKADVVNKDGARSSRACGTPQGGVISPLLANIFMHLAFDSWMENKYSHNPSFFAHWAIWKWTPDQ
ncbi:MAG: reverse transcriptase domain-containing protein [Bdellovibrionota bacterium]|nr:reverse transcriptase domain-containing protein [Bdellovibrionota bacterium]